MLVISRAVSSRISRRTASSAASPHLILPPGIPQRVDHLWVRIIRTSPAGLKSRAPTGVMGNGGGASIAQTKLLEDFDGCFHGSDGFKTDTSGAGDENADAYFVVAATYVSHV